MFTQVPCCKYVAGPSCSTICSSISKFCTCSFIMSPSPCCRRPMVAICRGASVTRSRCIAVTFWFPLVLYTLAKVASWHRKSIHRNVSCLLRITSNRWKDCSSRAVLTVVMISSPGLMSTVPEVEEYHLERGTSLDNFKAFPRCSVWGKTSWRLRCLSYQL